MPRTTKERIIADLKLTAEQIADAEARLPALRARRDRLIRQGLDIKLSERSMASAAGVSRWWIQKVKKR